MVTLLSHTFTAGSILYIRLYTRFRSSHVYTVHICVSPQRGLLLTQSDIYYMRLYCYDSYTDDPDVMDQLGYCSHSYTAQPLGIRFYIREDRLSLALLADSELVPRPKLDLIA